MFPFAKSTDRLSGKPILIRSLYLLLWMVGLFAQYLVFQPILSPQSSLFEHIAERPETLLQSKVIKAHALLNVDKPEGASFCNS